MIMRDFLLRAVMKLRAFGLGRLLIAPAGILVVLVLVQGLQYYSLARLEKTLIGSLEQAKEELPKRADAGELKEYDPITEHGILGTVSKPPPEKLWGIMGESVLFGASPDKAKFYKVGDKLPTGEKIVEIGCGEIVLEKDGKRRTESVFPELKEPAKPGERPAPAEGGQGPRAPLASDSSPKTERGQTPEEPVRPGRADEEVSAEPEDEDAATDRARAARRRRGFETRRRERRRREE